MNSIITTLPFLTFLLCAYSLTSYLECTRTGLAIAGIVVLLYVALTTELLSIFSAISQLSVTSVWILGFIASVFIASKVKSNFSPKYIRLECHWFAFIIPISLILTLLVALNSPPNTWDGMTYHMSRIVHWIDNGSISYYYTQIPRQNYMYPLCEEAIMHLQLLSQSDQYANLVAWSYFGLSIVLVSLITQAFKLGSKWETVSAVLASTLPMAIFQATGCKNDTTLSFLILLLILSLIHLRNTWSIRYSIIAGICLGLGLYCKGTFLFIGGACGLSFVIIELLPHFRSNQILSSAKHLIIILILGIFISSPYWVREFKTDFVGFTHESSIQHNYDKSVIGFASNTLRSAAVHLSLPNNAFNQGLYKVVQIVLGSHLNDPRTTYRDNPYQAYYRPHEDYAGNPVHFILISISILFLVITYKSLRVNQLLIIATLMISLIGFSFMLKWQPWVSRLHTPLFLIGIPLGTLVLSKISDSLPPKINTLSSGLIHGVLILTTLSALPALFTNYSRPLITGPTQSILQQERSKLYFTNRPELMQDYLTIDKILRSSNLGSISVGILCGEDGWEYPLLALSGASAGSSHAAYKLHHVQPTITESIIVGLGEARSKIQNNAHVRVVYRGNYASLYTSK